MHISNWKVISFFRPFPERPFSTCSLCVIFSSHQAFSWKYTTTVLLLFVAGCWLWHSLLSSQNRPLKYSPLLMSRDPYHKIFLVTHSCQLHCTLAFFPIHMQLHDDTQFWYLYHQSFPLPLLKVNGRGIWSMFTLSVYIQNPSILCLGFISLPCGRAWMYSVISNSYSPLPISE